MCQRQSKKKKDNGAECSKFVKFECVPQVDCGHCSQNRRQFKLRGEKAAGLRVIWCKHETAELSITEVNYRSQIRAQKVKCYFSHLRKIPVVTCKMCGTKYIFFSNTIY